MRQRPRTQLGSGKMKLQQGIQGQSQWELTGSLEVSATGTFQAIPSGLFLLPLGIS